jgi:hypothetical protein
MKETLYYKALKVIYSCNTVEQMQVAAKYIRRARGLLSDLSYAFIAKEAVIHLAKLEEDQNERG